MYGLRGWGVGLGFRGFTLGLATCMFFLFVCSVQIVQDLGFRFFGSS